MCFADWSRTDFINLSIAIGTFLTAGFTLGLIIVATKGFKKIYSEEAGKAQLKLMLEFITRLASEKMPITEMKSETNYFGESLYSKSFLEYTVEDLNMHTENLLLITETGYNSLASEYLHNPLMPNSVTIKIKELIELPKTPCNITASTIPPKIYFIPYGNPIERIFAQPMKSIDGGILKYIGACLDLKEAVRDWFSERGVSDLNSDFIS